MKIDLKTLPYSARGSYMVFSEVPADFRGNGNRAGLYLRTVHGFFYTPLVAKLTLYSRAQRGAEGACGSREAAESAGGEGEKTELSCESTLEDTVLCLQTGDGAVRLCFADDRTVYVRGSGPALVLDFLTETGPYDYIYEIPSPAGRLYMANCYKNNNRYLIVPRRGTAELDQQWEISSSLFSRLCFSGPEFEFVIREIDTEWDHTLPELTFEEAAAAMSRGFAAFSEEMPSFPPELSETARKAAYLNWSSIVRPAGFLRREAMFMSKNWMCNVWSWDHCFNAMALAGSHPELAWNQFMIMFDYQDPTGLIPDSVNDVHIVWNYCKPPVHGWALRRMRERMNLSREQKEEACAALGKWTEWWMGFRDYDGDGLCEYNHGNDSGWDNSTAFSALPPIATPELQAFLIIQMDETASLCDELGMPERASYWREKSDALMGRFLKGMFRDGLPVAVRSGSHEIVENESLLPYVCIILGERLPEDIRRKMLRELSGTRFLTEYGFATESPASPCYRSDGYWRGPIWAPSTLLILDGLERCGETELARSTARRFVKMAEKSGFAENFDALTGEGLRDRAYTWTSSVWLILALAYC